MVLTAEVTLHCFVFWAFFCVALTEECSLLRRSADNRGWDAGPL